ncbi:MAG TPA: hypothetical protein DEB39_10265 [Planctomycetaceae bacterium]|nr:hypothetical protein [Planctomycetaceae bacterium]
MPYNADSPGAEGIRNMGRESRRRHSRSGRVPVYSNTFHYLREHVPVNMRETKRILRIRFFFNDHAVRWVGKRV